MVKRFIRHISITLLAFYLTSVYLVPGFKVPLDLITYIKVVVVFSLLALIVKPILKIVFLPINFLTLGLFGWLINVLMLYLLKALVPSISFGTSLYPALNIYGYLLPSFSLPALWTVVLASFALTFLTKFLRWLLGK